MNGTANSIESPIESMETMLGRVLRTGVIISVTIVLLGLVLLLHGVSGTATPSFGASRVASFPHTIPGIWKGLLHANGQAVIMVGLFCLILTPILRVATSLVLFGKQGIRLYVAFSSFVLAVLLFSLLLGLLQGHGFS